MSSTSERARDVLTTGNAGSIDTDVSGGKVERVTQSRFLGLRLQQWLAITAFSVASVGVASCIRREPVVSKTPVATTTTASAGASAAPNTASRPPTGNYDKVTGVDVLDSEGGNPLGAIDPTQLLGIQLQFNCVSTDCAVDVTIDNLTFYK